jgi:hypothetical protein
MLIRTFFLARLVVAVKASNWYFYMVFNVFNMSMSFLFFENIYFNVFLIKEYFKKYSALYYQTHT